MVRTYFTESELRKCVSQYSVRDQQFSENLLNESTENKKHYDFFLSHSSADLILILGMYKKLTEMGFSVFFDKVDVKGVNINNMSNELKNAMNKSDYILYSHTHNSIDSKWVPWELGYFECKKNAENILIMPIENDLGKALYTGQEYLKQYHEISIEDLDDIRRVKIAERIRLREDILKDFWNGK